MITALIVGCGALYLIGGAFTVALLGLESKPHEGGIPVAVFWPIVLLIVLGLKIGRGVRGGS